MTSASRYDIIRYKVKEELIMNTTELLNDLTSALNSSYTEVSKLVLLDNMIEIDGVVSIINVSDNLDYDLNYRVDTRDSEDFFADSKHAIHYVIRELIKIRSFQSGSIVEKKEKKYMLVPDDYAVGNFYLLDLSTHQVNTTSLSKVDLYKYRYYLVTD